MKKVLIPGTETYGNWNESTYKTTQAGKAARIYIDGKEYHCSSEEMKKIRESALSLKAEIPSNPRSKPTTREVMQPCKYCGGYCYGDCRADNVK